ncbi:MAG: AraC family transcriptional regulator [Pseudomonadota bacterium]
MSAVAIKGDYAFVLDGPLRGQYDDEALFVLPLKGMARANSGSAVERAAVAGRAVYWPAPGRLALTPDGYSGFQGIVAVLGPTTRSLVEQGLPPLATAFDADPLVLSMYPSLRPWMTMSSDVRFPLDPNHVFAEFVTRRYAAHRDVLLRLPGSEHRRSGVYQRLLEAHASCEADGDVRVSDLGDRAHLSQAHFVRLFRTAFGLGPKQVLVRSRMTRAMNLLAWTGLSISELAPHCGYMDRTAFSRAFAATVGMAPLRFREQIERTGDRLRRFFQLRYEGLRC